jgi:hypothetical protein
MRPNDGQKYLIEKKISHKTNMTISHKCFIRGKNYFHMTKNFILFLEWPFYIDIKVM